MTIEIHNPELESILQQQLKAGNFASVEVCSCKLFAARSSPPMNSGRPKPLKLPRVSANSVKALRLSVPRDCRCANNAHMGTGID